MWLGNFAKASIKLFWVNRFDLNNLIIMQTYNEESDKGYFFEIDIQYPDKLYELYNDLSFLPERMKIEKVEKLVIIYMTKLNMLST